MPIILPLFQVCFHSLTFLFPLKFSFFTCYFFLLIFALFVQNIFFNYQPRWFCQFFFLFQRKRLNVAACQTVEWNAPICHIVIYAQDKAVIRKMVKVQIFQLLHHQHLWWKHHWQAHSSFASSVSRHSSESTPIRSIFNKILCNYCK